MQTTFVQISYDGSKMSFEILNWKFREFDVRIKVEEPNWICQTNCLSTTLTIFNIIYFKYVKWSLKTILLKFKKLPKTNLRSKLWQNQGRVFDSRSGCTCALCMCCYEAKRHNLKLKTLNKQLLVLSCWLSLSPTSPMPWQTMMGLIAFTQYAVMPSVKFSILILNDVMPGNVV